MEVEVVVCFSSLVISVVDFHANQVMSSALVVSRWL